MRHLSSISLLICLGSLAPRGAAGQSRAAAAPGPAAGTTVCGMTSYLSPADLSDPLAELERVAELAGRVPLRSRLIRRPSSQRMLPACSGQLGFPWERRLRPVQTDHGPRRLELLPLSWDITLNTGYPVDQNNGAVWAGRGLSTALHGGVTLRWGPVSAVLAPMLAYQQNRDFEIVPAKEVLPADSELRNYSEYLFPPFGPHIDWPQRFGDSGFWTFDAGQSALRLDALGVSVGVSNENLWWGPALRNPLLLSNSGPGFAHAFAGTSRPWNIRVGEVEAEAFWGRVSESDYFDAQAGNDHRLFTGMIFSFQPRRPRGLFLSAARMYLLTIPPDGLGPVEYLLKPYRGIAPVDTLNDQLIALSARWVFPESSFEAYAEWAREDTWADVEDLLGEPNHSQAYTVGFQKLLRAGPRNLRLYGEMTHLQSSSSFRSGRQQVSFYIHSLVRQGYTHRGQLLGAAIGPGANSQTLGIDLLTRRGRLGLFASQTVYSMDAYFKTWVQNDAARGRDGRDQAVSTGMRHTVFLGSFDLDWQASYERRRNRNFSGLRAGQWDPSEEGNWTVALRLTWHPEAAIALRRGRSADLPVKGNQVPE
ncbi:MAG: hypothetical protein HY703_06050 [Gemmatimonadetes bacterium]|nr:hypothetical protein [Gemmatimonadota bacterium]